MLFIDSHTFIEKIVLEFFTFSSSEKMSLLFLSEDFSFISKVNGGVSIAAFGESLSTSVPAVETSVQAVESLFESDLSLMSSFSKTVSMFDGVFTVVIDCADSDSVTGSMLLGDGELMDIFSDGLDSRRISTDVGAIGGLVSLDSSFGCSLGSSLVLILVSPIFIVVSTIHLRRKHITLTNRNVLSYQGFYCK